MDQKMTYLDKMKLRKMMMMKEGRNFRRTKVHARYM